MHNTRGDATVTFRYQFGPGSLPCRAPCTSRTDRLLLERRLSSEMTGNVGLVPDIELDCLSRVFPACVTNSRLEEMKRFHSFRLDPRNQCLWRGEQRVSITPKAFDVLRYLVEHPGRLVTQEEILEALWPETYVNQEVVKKYILGIRKVLGDRHDKPVFIETFPRRGYQFVAKVIEERA